MGDNKLLMPFIGENDDPKFVNGFECGQLWEIIKDKKEVKGYLFHSDNIDQMHLICKHYKVVYGISPIDETWSTLTIIKNKLNLEYDTVKEI